MSYIGLVVLPILIFLLHWKRRAGQRRVYEDRSDEPQLSDTFVTAPDGLTAAITEAGGDPERVVAWFESGGRSAFRFVITGQQAFDAWRKLRDRFEMAGYWPVILGPIDSVRCHNDSLEANSDLAPAKVLQKATTVDIQAWQKKKLLENLDCDPEYSRPLGEGDWPSTGKSELTEYQAPLNILSQQPYKQVWIGLLPVRHSWEVPALMRFGDWNEVPPPEVHVAMHQRWSKDFGAELVSMTHDVLEFRVARPPETREAAKQLAELQYDYCPDIVDQGVGTIKVLAATILNGERWFFWWD